MTKHSKNGPVAPVPWFTMGIVLTILGGVAAFFFVAELPRRERNQSIEFVTSRFNGHVTKVSSCPEWLRAYVADTFVAEYFDWVLTVDAYHVNPVDYDDVDYLAGFPHLERLSIDFTHSVDSAAVLSHLPYSPDLKSLRLVGTAALPAPARLPNLERLELQGAAEQGSEPLLAAASRLPELRELVVRNLGLDPAGWSHITTMSRLEYLVLESNGLADDDLAPLRTMTSLQHLGLSSNPGIGDAAMEHVAALHDLRYLNLNDTAVGDAGLKHVAGLRKLQWLYLMNARVGNDGVAELPRLKHLRFLSLRRGWDPPVVLDDDAIPALKRLKRLEAVDLWNSDITRQGFADLSLALPTTRVTFRVRRSPSRGKRAKEARRR